MQALKVTFVGMTGALLAAAVLGLVSAYIDPALFWPSGLFAIGLPGFVIVLGAAAVGLGAMRRWRTVGMVVILIAVFLPRHFSTQRFTLAEARDDDQVLMTYNLPRAPDDLQAKREVFDVVASAAPDIIALQEANVWATKRHPDRLRSHPKLKDLVDSLGYRTLRPDFGPPAMHWTHWLNPAISRIPILNQQQIAVPSKVEGWPRLILFRSVFELDGRQFAHYNVHLRSHGSRKPWSSDRGVSAAIQSWTSYLSQVRHGFSVRSWEVREIKKLIDAEELPVILSGDFNSTPDSWSYAVLSSGLQDAFRIAGTGWGATFPAWMPLVRIDFVLLSDEFEVVRAYLPTPYPTSSDHRPLVVRYRWR